MFLLQKPLKSGKKTTYWENVLSHGLDEGYVSNI